ncbi:MAG: hypothetical protein LRS48_02780, partial [Desulfurococcales archaeon]|nr:hypothetical protein [Desulfurococcales archaeon]
YGLSNYLSQIYNNTNLLKSSCTAMESIRYPSDRCEYAWRASSASPVVRQILANSLGSFRKPVDDLLQYLEPKNIGAYHKYYPPIITAQAEAERVIMRGIKRSHNSLNISNVKYIIGQYVRNLVPHCYDGCYHCVMSEDCFAKYDFIQEKLLSKSAGLMLCKSIP